MEHILGRFIFIAFVCGLAWLIKFGLGKLSRRPRSSASTPLLPEVNNFDEHSQQPVSSGSTDKPNYITELKTSADENFSEHGWKGFTQLIFGLIGLFLVLGLYIGFIKVSDQSIGPISVLLGGSLLSIGVARFTKVDPETGRVEVTAKRKLGAFSLLSLWITLAALLLFGMFFVLRGNTPVKTSLQNETSR